MRTRRLLLEPLEDRRLLTLAPELVDLQAASDSGLFDDDDLTNIAEATIDITAAEAGDVIRVYSAGELLGEASPAAGVSYEYQFAADQLAEGANTITARAFDGLDESEDSPALVITLDTTGPRIIANAPDSPVNLRTDTLDSVTLTFNEPIDFDPAGGTLADDDVTITGRDGAIAPADITAQGGNDYQIAFAAQTRRGTYTVSLGPDVADLAGNVMDQDEDGQPGEPEDVFTFAFDAYDYTYDAMGNVTGIEDPLRKETGFTYTSAFNDLASVTDARDNGLDYAYDSAGNLTSITYEDQTVESFTYDDAGNVLAWTNRRDETVTYTYNAAGQLTSKDYPDTVDVIDCEYGYDAAGNLVSATDPSGTTLMQYDPDTDWLTRIEYPGGQFFAFEHDDAGRRTRRTDQDGNVVNYIHDGLGRLDRMTDGTDALIVDYDYDAAGWLARKTLGNSVYTTYDYDDTGQLLHLVNYASDDAVLSRFDYTYDASGRRTAMGTHYGTWTYQYDPTGQLVHAVLDSTDTDIPDQDLVYEYDAVGNRIRTISNGVVTEYATNSMNQYDQVGEATYTFDADGNMTSKTEDGVTTTYSYNAENRLVRVEVWLEGTAEPTDTWAYVYDAFGNRVASSHNGEATN